MARLAAPCSDAAPFACAAATTRLGLRRALAAGSGAGGGGGWALRGLTLGMARPPCSAAASSVASSRARRSSATSLTTAAAVCAPATKAAFFFGRVVRYAAPARGGCGSGSGSIDASPKSIAAASACAVQDGGAAGEMLGSRGTAPKPGVTRQSRRSVDREAEWIDGAAGVRTSVCPLLVVAAVRDGGGHVLSWPAARSPNEQTGRPNFTVMCDKAVGTRKIRVSWLDSPREMMLKLLAGQCRTRKTCMMC